MIENYLSERQKKRRNRRKYFFGALTALAVYFVLLAMAWLAFRSPLFRVRAITVEGNAAVPAADIVTLLQSSALRDHGFLKSLLGIRSMFIWPREFSAEDLAFIPRLSSATISRDYFSHTVTVKVVERSPLAIWCLMPTRDAHGNAINDEQCFWFDDHGIVFARTFDTQGGSIVSVHDYTKENLGLTEKVLPDIFVDHMLSVIDAVRASGINIKEMAVRDIALQEVDITTFNGPDIYFSLRFPADNDLAVLKSLMQKPGFGKLQYVDFRVENRAYYK